MSSFLINTFALIIFLKTTCTQDLRPRIVGGTETTLSKYPFIVSLRFEEEHACGCSILNERWLLTAGHCVFETEPSDFDVHYGSTELDEGLDNVVAVEEIVEHENYNNNIMFNDIALIKTSSDLPLSDSLQPVKLAENVLSIYNPKSSWATVIGWGLTEEYGDVSNVLQEVKIQIFSKIECKRKYGWQITGQQLCGGVRWGGKDACQGDSGGPLVENGVQVGIVSWGEGCGIAGKPGVYTEVASYLDWIYEKIPELRDEE